MNRMAEFSKVSFQQFKNDWVEEFTGLTEEIAPDVVDKHVRNIYDEIKLPERATYMSAGYDFFSPMTFTLEPGESIKIPTGIRCEMYDGWVLMEFPRSGLGFKYGLSMANTVGVIDGDYAYSDNEGHIFVKLTNDSSLAKVIRIEKGEAFCQGIFLPFGITLDDDTTEVRNGGFGSTDKKEQQCKM